ncbi:MAG: indole-3-glycerol phosphate synthase TrpC [Clostridiales bacterium]|jgi:indole-3-glycerol phosphate synthase|nr:indole-3-glycerol phosphate synthase TrpC [Clostridiales bacterium]
MILDKLAKSTFLRVEERKKEIPLGELRERALSPFVSGLFPFENAIKKEGLSFICEVKKASPSKGLIAENFPYREIAEGYERNGADAVSVLTEPEYFLGDDSYLTEIKSAVSIPVLRKDFTIDEYQIYEAKLLGADAVLLICALLDTEKLKGFIAAADLLGLSALVEAHTESEIVSALRAGARLIGVNNRDLKTFTVDLETSIELRKLVPHGIPFVSESGIATARDIERLVTHGIDGVLIGETLMRAEKPWKKLKELIKSSKN